MYKSIEEKINLLNQKKPFRKDFSLWIEESSLWGWIFTCLKLRGTPIDKGTVVSLLRGEILEQVPLEIYDFVYRYRDVYRDIKNSLEMRNSLTEKLLNRYYDMIFEESQTRYRQNNPVIYEWHYNPPHFRDIDDQLDLFFRNFAIEAKSLDPLSAAAIMHLRILEIYPYGVGSVTMASVALLYVLMEKDLPVPHLFASEQEYNTQVSVYLHSGDISLFKEMLGRSLLNRLNVLLQVNEALED
ncbi:MAG: hypothetical protein EOM59_04825 [Clostridia bacterium]|nr:hypothetical protein [Clostridia bacterium]